MLDVVQTLVEAQIGGVDENMWMRYSKKVHCNTFSGFALG